MLKVIDTDDSGLEYVSLPLRTLIDFREVLDCKCIEWSDLCFSSTCKVSELEHVVIDELAWQCKGPVVYILNLKLYTNDQKNNSSKKPENF